MSDTRLKDGSGKNYSAKVNADQRLWVDASQRSESALANLKGDAYNINTGTINLTDAVDTAVLYVKNSNDMALIIEAIAVGVGPTTGGTGGMPTITVVRNPTAASFSTDVDIKTNRNYGSTNTLTDVVAYKGATGATLTAGDDHLLFYQASSGRLFATINEVIPKGGSIGVKFDPQANNTSQDIYVALICYQLDDSELK